ncbi:MAG TPA: hypothetical protein VGP86_11005, partial [Xanthobacteraceae bacterium]|nr:hypothetical protein [Xanthobacteraceae bacterium]
SAPPVRIAKQRRAQGVQGNAPAVTALPKVMHGVPLGMARPSSPDHTRRLRKINYYASIPYQPPLGDNRMPYKTTPARLKTTTDRLKILREKRDQLDAQLRALEARAKQAERKADTRRKVIFGALGREHYEKNPDSEFHHIMFRLLDEYVVRPSDLFSELVEADLQRHATAAGSIRAAD